MSTVIKDGLKFTGSIKELFDELLPIRQRIVADINEDLISEAHQCMARIIEFSVIMTEKDLLDYFRDNFKEGTTDEEMKKTSLSMIARLYMRDYYHNFYEEQLLMIYPYSDNEFYLHPFGCKLTIDRVKENPLFEDFSYWNNVDRPKEVTEAEWVERERIWNEIFKHAGTEVFKDAGIIFPIHSTPPTLLEILQIPYPESFIRNLKWNPKFAHNSKITIYDVSKIKLGELIAL